MIGGHAQQILEDDYQFNIYVVNRWSKPVEEFKSKVKLKNGKAKIQVRAHGYLPASQEILLLDGQLQYDVKLKVRGIWTDIEVFNTAGEHVTTVPRELGSEVASDQYRVEIAILDFYYSHFTSWDVDLTVDNWPILGADIQVVGAGFQRRIIITLPRKHFRFSYRPRIRIEIPRDGYGLKEARTTKFRKLRFQIHNNLNADPELIRTMEELEGLLKR